MKKVIFGIMFGICALFARDYTPEFDSRPLETTESIERMNKLKNKTFVQDIQTIFSDRTFEKRFYAFMERRTKQQGKTITKQKMAEVFKKSGQHMVEFAKKLDKIYAEDDEILNFITKSLKRKMLVGEMPVMEFYFCSLSVDCINELEKVQPHLTLIHRTIVSNYREYLRELTRLGVAPTIGETEDQLNMFVEIIHDYIYRDIL